MNTRIASLLAWSIVATTLVLHGASGVFVFLGRHVTRPPTRTSRRSGRSVSSSLPRLPGRRRRDRQPPPGQRDRLALPLYRRRLRRLRRRVALRRLRALRGAGVASGGDLGRLALRLARPGRLRLDHDRAPALPRRKPADPEVEAGRGVRGRGRRARRLLERAQARADLHGLAPGREPGRRRSGSETNWASRHRRLRRVRGRCILSVVAAVLRYRRSRESSATR